MQSAERTLVKHILILSVVAVIGFMTTEGRHNKECEEDSCDPKNYQKEIRRHHSYMPTPDNGRLGPVVLDAEPNKRGMKATGTAFAIGDGYFLTARHVVESCSKLSLANESGIKLARVNRVLVHQNTDLAVISAPLNTGTHMVLHDSDPLPKEAFHSGFPAGRPGDAYSTFIGKTNIRSRNGYNIEDKVYAWSMKEKVPYNKSMAGISGGPTYGADGKVLGVNIAEAPRRGRFFTSIPSSNLAALKNAGVAIPTSEQYGIVVSKSNYMNKGDELRKENVVVKVVCN